MVDRVVENRVVGSMGTSNARSMWTVQSQCFTYRSRGVDFRFLNPNRVLLDSIYSITIYFRNHSRVIAPSPHKQFEAENKVC
jgi:hypothetical protein